MAVKKMVMIQYYHYTALLPSRDALGPMLEQQTQNKLILKWYAKQCDKLEVWVAIQVINRPGVANTEYCSPMYWTTGK